MVRSRFRPYCTGHRDLSIFGHTLSNPLKFAPVHWWDKIVRPIPEMRMKSDLCLYYITLGCIEKANGSLFSMLCLSEKYPVTLLRCSRSPQNWGHPRRICSDLEISAQNCAVIFGSLIFGHQMKVLKWNGV